MQPSLLPKERTVNIFISPYVQETFRAQRSEPAWDFISVCKTSSVCPPTVIARAAIQYLELGVEIDTAGYDIPTLDRILGITGYYDVEVRISYRQANELAAIGRSLLEVHAAQPELRYVTTNMFDTQDEWEILDHLKEESIRWLIQVVESAQ